MKNKHLLATLVGILLLSSAVSVLAVWTPPTLPFPQGSPSAPLDESNLRQTKPGTLRLDVLDLTNSSFNNSVILGSGQKIFSGTNYFGIGEANGNSVLSNPSYIFNIDTKGIILPRPAAAPVSPVAGTIYYKSGDKSVQLYDGSVWKAIGAGAASQWANITGGGINYVGGNVGIGAINPTARLEIKGDKPIDVIGNGTNASIGFSVQGGDGGDGGAGNSIKGGKGADIILSAGNGGYAGIGGNGGNVIINPGRGDDGQSKKGTSGKIYLVQNGGEVCIGSVCRSTWPSGATGAGLSGGTANYIPLWQTDSSLSSSALYQDATNKIGIGTTNPSEKLDVEGRVTIAPSGTEPDNAYNGNLIITKPKISGQYINLIRSGSYPWSIGTVYNSDNFAIGTGLADDTKFINPAFVINTVGNIGVGTTIPESKLDVSGNFRAGGTVLGNNFINPAKATEYRKIATLPPTSSGTYDHFIMTFTADNDWGSSSKSVYMLYFANRTSFTYRWSSNGDIRLNSGVLAYQEPNGSVSIWYYHADKTYTAVSYSILESVQATVYPTPVEGTPTGKMIFSTIQSDIYKPYMVNTNSGNVGIGVANPTDKLNIKGGNILMSGGNIRFEVPFIASPEVVLYVGGSGSSCGSLDPSIDYAYTATFGSDVGQTESPSSVILAHAGGKCNTVYLNKSLDSRVSNYYIYRRIGTNNPTRESYNFLDKVAISDLKSCTHPITNVSSYCYTDNGSKSVDTSLNPPPYSTFAGAFQIKSENSSDTYTDLFRFMREFKNGVGFRSYVGINTDHPVTTFNLVGDINTPPVFRIDPGTSSDNAELVLGYDSGNVRIGGAQGGGKHWGIYAKKDGSLNFWNDKDLISIDSSGKMTVDNALKAKNITTTNLTTTNLTVTTENVTTTNLENSPNINGVTTKGITGGCSGNNASDNGMDCWGNVITNGFGIAGVTCSKGASMMKIQGIGSLGMMLCISSK